MNLFRNPRCRLRASTSLDISTMPTTLMSVLTSCPVLARIVFAATSILLLVFGGAEVRAAQQTYVWDGGGGNDNWNTANNWNPNTTPTFDNQANLQFAGTTRLTNTNNTAGTIRSLTFNSGAGAFDLRGNSVLIANAAGIVNSSTNLQTVSLASITNNTAGMALASTSGELLINSQLVGTGGFTLTGTRTTLAGSNSYSGTTTVSSGALRIANGSALGTTAGGTAVSSGAALELSNSISVGAEALSIAGTGISSGGALRNVSGNNNYGGLLTLTAAARINSDSGTLTLTNTGTITGATFGLTLGGAGNIVVNSVIGTTSGTLTKDGAGTATLTASNTYTGATTISDGALRISNASALGSTASGTTVQSGAALELVGGISVGAEALSLAGSGINTNGSLRSISGSNTYGGSIGLGTLVHIGVDAGSLTLTGGITNAAGSSLTKVGSGTLIINGLDNSTGIHNVNEGTLQLGASGSFNNSLAVSVGNGATLDLNGRNTTLGASGNPTITLTGGTIKSGSGTLTLNPGLDVTVTSHASTNSSTISGHLNLGGRTNTFVVADGAAADDLVISAAISNGGLIKTNAGRMVLSASNSFSGTTTVAQGTLELRSTGGAALGSTASVTVNSGATLLVSESNQVNDSATVTLSGGTIQRASGKSEVFGNLSLTAPSTLDFGNGTAGTLSFGTYTPTSLLTVENFFLGNVLTFTSDLSSTIHNGSLFSFDNGFTTSWNGSTFTITAIPEPATVVAALGLLGLMLWPLRRHVIRAAR